MRSRAAFVDRDGIVNELVYYPDPGIVDSPFVPSQFELVDGIGPALREIRDDGFKLVVVSNQPGVAKKHFTMGTFKKMQARMHRLLEAEGVRLDGEYYCFHHPQARVAKYRVECDCRKPKPGMMLRAAKELDLDLAASFFIGDGLSDVTAGKRAGVKTILVANLSSLLGRMMAERGAEPDFLARNVAEAADIVKNQLTEVPVR
jgi:D-glycero-D-manno-heptose 1,7-bisphosphate phosphatase